MRENIKVKIGSIELLILKILSEGDCYGYQITQAIEERSGGVISTNAGSLYPSLYRMQEKGYVSDYKEKVGNRRKRIYYHLEPEGYQELEQLEKEYRILNKAILSVLDHNKGISERSK